MHTSRLDKYPQLRHVPSLGAVVLGVTMRIASALETTLMTASPRRRSTFFTKSRRWPRAANGAYVHSVEKYLRRLKRAYSTMSFSYVRIKGLTRGMVATSPSVPSSVARPVLALEHRARRAVSPRVTFSSTVSAASSALCPVATFVAPSSSAPRSSACRRNTPQNVQLFRFPTAATISSIDQPYSCLYETTRSGMP